jgi:GNAT superfamily N-acetyltransferase
MILYQREPNLSVEEYIEILERSTLAERRPVDDKARIAQMLEHANLIITAREDGKLIGANRCLTDFSFFCYCADLSVDKNYQGQGIGSALLDKAREFLHPKTHTYLVAAPDAITFYEHIGLERLDRLFRIPSTSDVPQFSDLKKYAE